MRCHRLQAGLRKRCHGVKTFSVELSASCLFSKRLLSRRFFAALLQVLLCFPSSRFVTAVLRFPDDDFDSRWPLHYTDCTGRGTAEPGTAGDSSAADTSLFPHADLSAHEDDRCFRQLQVHTGEDLVCGQVIPEFSFVPHTLDQVALSTCTEFVSLYNETFAAAEEQRQTAIKGGDSISSDGKSADSKSLIRETHDAYLAKWQQFVELVQRRTTEVLSYLQSGAAEDPQKYQEQLDVPAYANTTLDVLQAHLSKLTDEVEAVWESGVPKLLRTPMSGQGEIVEDAASSSVTTANAMESLSDLLHATAHVIYTRVCLLIENWSMTVLTNFHIWRLEGDSAATHILASLRGNTKIPQPNYIFHDIGPKRWNVLRYLIENKLPRKGLLASSTDGKATIINGDNQPYKIRMLEVGVDQANTTERLLQTYSNLFHVGVDPWQNKPVETGVRDVAVNGDLTFERVQSKLRRFGDRSVLLRMTSYEASLLYEPASSAAAVGAAGELQQDRAAASSANSISESDGEKKFDLIFLDALHDHASVVQDVLQWIWKVDFANGAILCGHDYQWQYPGLPMAVVTVAQRVGKQVHLSSDGMWWMEFL
ncbi:unnamed protein product [Amoebophrya sp. A120]|nr:unnamed protein product [Amoebophrya sp. A120]|eukprot:GSA120T00004237001.1